MRNKRLALGLTLAILAGCTSLGSRQADQRRAVDIGATTGQVAAATTPGILDPLVVPLVSMVTELASREGQRRAETRTDAEGLDWMTQLLLGVGAAGGAFTFAKTGLRKVKAEVAPPKV